ncbi:MAG: hypothetical protein K2N04_03670 [Alistipes sp.]|nr:hypothetical protein [Alistipes sp.]
MNRLVILFGILAIASSCNKDDAIVVVDASRQAACNRVYEYLPAPGQFINETYAPRTMEEACAWAEKQLANRYGYVSLGSFGGCIVVGFDHRVACTGGYDLAVDGNPLDTSSEPGIVWVMQDENGDGLPNDTWYELRGSEYGKPETWQDYTVTYYRPEENGASIRWEDDRGGSGTIDRVGYHRQESYYPAWVEAGSYTLRGTRLEARNRFDGVQWVNPPYEWGYADNFSAIDRIADSGTNRFRIVDAVQADGQPARLDGIDFVKVQTGVLAQSGDLGEASTEIFAIRDLNSPLR